MKRLLQNMLTLSVLVFTGCEPNKMHTKVVSHRSNDWKTSVNFAVQPKNGLALTNPLNAAVKDIEVVCDGGLSKYPFSLTADNQILQLDRNLTGCSYALKSFFVSGMENMPVSNPVYNISNVTAQTKDGQLISAYDLVNDKGDLLDRRLMSSVVQEKDSSCPDQSCLIYSVNVSFQYSQLERTDVVLQNTLKIEDLTVSISDEPAPNCKVAAEFVTDMGGGAPGLKITMSECVNLFDSKMLAFGLATHHFSNVYQIYKLANDPQNVVGLHSVIDGANKTANMGDNGGVYSFVLSLDDLKALTGKTTTMGAVRENLVLATRNTGGKSIHYYVIKNTCTSEIVDRMNENIAKLNFTSWMVDHPGPGSQSYFKITGASGDVYPGFCVDTDRTVRLGYQYSGHIVSTYDFDMVYREHILERPNAMPAVNWLINTYLLDTNYTYGELQKAIWNLVDDQVVSNGLGPVDESKVLDLVNAARTHGMNFVPTTVGQYMAVLLIPMENGVVKDQSAIAITKIPAVLCVPTKTCKN